MDLRHAITREARISAAINGVLSAVFFFLVFGTDGEPVTTAAPDNYAFDFVIQGAIVALMAALVPSFLLRKKIASIAARRPTNVKVVASAVVTMLVAALVAFGFGQGVSGLADSIAVPAALGLKVLFGAGLGYFITSSILRFHFI
jgi:hypothetical protein